MRALVIAMFVVSACGEVQDQPPVEGSFTVAVDAASVFVRDGEHHEVGVTVARDNFDDPIDITVDGLPAGVTAMPLTIDTGQTTGVLDLVAAPAAQQGEAALTVTGSSGAEAHDASLRLLVGGAPGSLDRSFAGDGTFTTSVPGMVLISRAIAQGDDGTILVTGSTATQAITARITPGGELDTSFGGAGFVSTGVGAFSEGIALTTIANGSVLVAGVAGGPGGSGDNDFGIFKYGADGTLDTTFGSSGVASFDPGNGFGELHTIIVAPDGSLLVGGDLFGNTGGVTGRLLRFAADGVRDAAYNVTEPDALIEAAVLQPDGKLVMAGGQNGNFWLARYNPNGSRDAGFGTNGVVTTAFSPDSATANGLVLVAGGKLLAVGVAGTGTSKHIVVTRYNANGSLDLAFGIGGKVVTTTPFDTRSPNAAIVDPDGHILFVGFQTSPNRPSVARLDAQGALDPGFATDGVATIDFGIAGTTSQTGGYGIALDADGRIVFAGEVGPAGGQNMAVGRLWP